MWDGNRQRQANQFPGCSESAGLKSGCPRKAAQLFLPVNIPDHVGIQFFGPVGIAVIGRAIGDVIVEKEFGVTIHKNQVAATVMPHGKTVASRTRKNPITGIVARPPWQVFCERVESLFGQ